MLLGRAEWQKRKWNRTRAGILTVDRESGFYEFIFFIHEFYWILKMPNDFYFEIRYFNLTEKL